MRKYIVDEIYTPSQISEFYNRVEFEIHLVETPTKKVIRYFFNDGSDIVIEYTTTGDKILTKSKDYRKIYN
jgi:hypothetical protein